MHYSNNLMHFPLQSNLLSSFQRHFKLRLFGIKLNTINNQTPEKNKQIGDFKTPNAVTKKLYVNLLTTRSGIGVFFQIFFINSGLLLSNVDKELTKFILNFFLINSFD